MSREATTRVLVEAAPAAAMAAAHCERTPLHAVVVFGHDAAVRVLLQAAPAAAMAADEDDYLPLHAAAEYGRAGATRLLLEAVPAAAMTGAGPGWLPLHIAAELGFTDVVRLLVEAAPQTATAAPEGGCIPLECVSRPDLPAARALLGAGPAAVVLTALAEGQLPLFPDFFAGAWPPAARGGRLGTGADALPRHRARAACGAGLLARTGGAGGAGPAARRCRAPARDSDQSLAVPGPPRPAARGGGACLGALRASLRVCPPKRSFSCGLLR